MRWPSSEPTLRRDPAASPRVCAAATTKSGRPLALERAPRRSCSRREPALSPCAADCRPWEARRPGALTWSHRGASDTLGDQRDQSGGSVDGAERSKDTFEHDLLSLMWATAARSCARTAAGAVFRALRRGLQDGCASAGSGLVRPGTGLGSAGLARCPCAAKGGGPGADCESPAHSDRVEETADGQRTQCHAAERAAEEEAGH